MDEISWHAIWKSAKSDDDDDDDDAAAAIVPAFKSLCIGDTQEADFQVFGCFGCVPVFFNSNDLSNQL